MVVNPFPTTTGLTGTSPGTGQVQLIATVDCSSPCKASDLNGINVTFKEGGAVVGTIAVNGSGKATLNLTGASAAGHTYTATFVGDTDHATSTSTSVTVTLT